jgi:phage I-like protein
MDDRLEQKLELILAKLDDNTNAIRIQESVLSLVLASLNAIPPYLETHTEMLRQLMELAGDEDAKGDDSFQALMQRFEQLLTQQSRDLAQIRMALQNIPEQVETATAEGMKLAMGAGGESPAGHA